VLLFALAFRLRQHHRHSRPLPIDLGDTSSGPGIRA
jgi:hypothetical protein